MEKIEEKNILETDSIKKLITQFSIPAIIGGLVGALYNIVDQIFIGHYVGVLGNAATNVAFPITTISTSLALLIGVGAASNYSLFAGERKEEKANSIIGNALLTLSIIGIILSVVTLLFLEPLLHLFGVTPDVLPYAIDYTKIIAIGLPFFIFSSGGSHIIRATGSPRYAMFSSSIGAVLNIFLDALFIIGFKLEMKGAAIATIIGQCISALFVLFYFIKSDSIQLIPSHFKIKFRNLTSIMALGASDFFNQIALTIFQIVMNNTLTYYGSSSKYGSDIPLAIVGVVSKVYVIFISVVVGVAQGSQPILGYNYGAKNYGRVKATFKEALKRNLIFALICFFIFQLFPRQILSIFGGGNELYYEFGVKYLRIFMFTIFLNGIQPLVGNFFTAIGRAKIGVFISLTRRILFLTPLVIILPIYFGIDGVLFAGPIADTISAILGIIFITREFRIINEKEKANE